MVDVWAVQQDLQAKAFSEVAAFEARVLKDITRRSDVTSSAQTVPPDQVEFVVDLVTDFAAKQADVTLTAWQKLFPKIITTYHDGYHALNLTSANINMFKLFYPAFWLDNVGFFNTHKNSDPNSLLFASLPVTGVRGGLLGAVVFTTCLAFGAGMLFQQRLGTPIKRSQYMPIGDSNL